MGRVGDLVVRIVGEDAQFRASIDKSEKKLKDFDKTAKKLSDSLTKVGKKMTTFVTLPILGIGAAFVKAASDAEEVNSKFNIVFKDQAAGVREWAQEFSQATGRATVDNVKFLAAVQDLFVPLGITRDKAADLSKSVVTLATDVSSFNNLPTKDVLRDIQSALVGNHETVRKYGVILDEATVNQELLNMGVRDGYKAATAAEKAIARYNLIVQGTADAQGDAIRTAGSFANRFRALQSSVKDLAETFGNLLLPTIQKFVEEITKAVRWVGGLSEEKKQLIIKVAALAAAIGPALLVLGKMVALVNLLAVSTATLNTIMLATPWGLLAAGLAGSVISIRNANKYRREQKLLELDLLALKDEMINARKEEKVSIQEATVARVRELLVIAESHATEMQALRDKKDIFGRAGKYALLYGQAAIEARDKVRDFKEMLSAETDVLFRLEVEHDRAYGRRKILLPQLEEHTEKTGDQAGATGDLSDAIEILNVELQEWIANQLEIVAGLPTLSRAQLGLTDIMSGFVDELQRRKQTFEDLAQTEKDYGATALEIVQATTQAHNERHEIIAANIKREVNLEKEASETIIDYKKAVMDASISIIGSISQISDNYYQGLLDNENLTDKERKRILRDQAKSAKTFNIFQAVINTARAIVEALPNIWLSALAGITGATQIAAIASTPLPKLAEGGVTPALLHPNEAILPLDNEEAMSRIANAIANVPAPSVNVGGNLFHISVNLGNKVLYDDIARATKDRRILIDAGAVV